MNLLAHHAGDLGRGVVLTLELIALAWVGALVLGTVLAALRISPIRTARAVSWAYVLVFRNVPLPVQMVLFVFGLPLLGIQYSLFVSAVVVLVMYTGAFVCETLRSGLNTVDAGELEACRALGFPPAVSLRLVLLPQAFASVIRPLGNVLITMVKNTSVAALVGVAELTFVSDKAAVDEAQPFVMLGVAALCYLVIGLAIGRGVSAVDQKVAFTR